MLNDYFRQNCSNDIYIKYKINSTADISQPDGNIICSIKEKIMMVFGQIKSNLILAKCLFLVIILCLGVGASSAVEKIIDVEDTLGPKACISCHKEEGRAWKATQHYKTYKEIPRKRIAKKRAKKMRFKHIKMDSLCMNCHFTAVKAGSRVKVVSGISCESCHGASKKWLQLHSDFGGRNVKAISEISEHKKERFLNAERNGMIQLSNVYDSAKNCYRCHTVPEEKLVNIGRHPAGSDFELVQWGQGEGRHNLWYESFNKPLAQGKLRVKFVVGKALDLEYALRGLVNATSDARYFQAMIERKSRALADIKSINTLVFIPQLTAIMSVLENVVFNVGNDKYGILAEQIEQLNRQFSIEADGTKLSALDSLLPSPESYKGDVYQP